ncbi:hypothetical protein TTHERM_00647230 (macronuclear) [Tetrahymena thermophila SB210]|uniref:Uncharacterized protein n=1 Tax=Tetrahymena thermophila (strain SB210) TaxID=312017 RepID=I7M4J7_TETTS|nr:hypothetical protein TTHERM_00647230 [Tetrahymena thermophila SB210]EAS07190.1 hypothetical protein TTHERM_00647230 [Tetrahymena thermophila SB210]|eukprot:XP_001027432.1 hypothetical protein TTHERM_00647230 [Tetrahymena thermophila SB210]
MITNKKKEGQNTGLSKFSDCSMQESQSKQKHLPISIPSLNKRVVQNLKEINQNNCTLDQQKKEQFTDLKDRQKNQQQLEDQYNISIAKQHTFNERKRAFSSPQPFYYIMRDSLHINNQLIATPTFGDDDWKSKQLQYTKDKKDSINGCQSSPKNQGEMQGYDVLLGSSALNNNSIIHASKESDINLQVINNDSIGLQLKLANHQITSQNGENNKKRKKETELDQQFVDVNQSMFYQTPHLFPQQSNPNDISCQSAGALESFESGINSSSALKHPKISKKSPLFEKFGQQQQGRQRSPDSHFNQNNVNLSAYNYPSMSKQSSKYSNIYLGTNNSSSSLQNSQCQFQLGVNTETDIPNDHTPLKRNPLSSLYTHQINTGRSTSDKKQIYSRVTQPNAQITSFNLRMNSEASILAIQQNTNNEQDKNIKLNFNNTSSFLPQIEQPQQASLLSQHVQSAKHSNEIRMIERGFSEEGSSILNSIQRSNNFNHVAKYPLKRISSVDEQTISTCFTSIKASSPIKKNRNDIFNDFTAQTQKTQDSEIQQTTQQHNNQSQEDQLNLLQGEKLNFNHIQAQSKQNSQPLNIQDRQEDNLNQKMKESIRKKGREQSLKLANPQNTLELIKNKNPSQTPQTVSNTLGSLVQFTARDEAIDDLLNLKLEKIEIKKQNSQKRSSPSLDPQRNQNSNPPSTDIPDDENLKFINQPPQINSYRHRKPNSIYISSLDKQKRAESAKNKSKLNFFQNGLIKKEQLQGKKVEPESAKFSHPGRKLSIKQNDVLNQSDSHRARLIIPKPIQQEDRTDLKLQINNSQNDIENLYNPQHENIQKHTEKICNRIQGMFQKQKEIYEQKYKRKMTANKEEIDLLKQLNSALDELKNVHTYSSQTSSNKNNNCNNNINNNINNNQQKQIQ